MNIRWIFLIMLAGLLFPQRATSQVIHGITDFPELINANIPGAPKLHKPTLITGSSNPVIAEGHGLVAPALWDMDGDGMRDLLMGEFASGIHENGRYIGNFIRVYKNEGIIEEKPEFTGKFNYARPPFEYRSLANGTPYSVDQYCCIGFTPQFIDLDQDGNMDMISGQYQGEVSWFRGSEAGFLPGEALPQEGGDPRGKDWTKHQDYWMYSSASFGDFTGDGLADLVTGGTSLRISKNVGTKNNPRFAHRELLLDVQDNPLKVYEYTKVELDNLNRYVRDFDIKIPEVCDYKVSPYVVDWDNDGMLDLLVTNSYIHKGLSVVDFFKGVKINGVHRFQKAIPLFTAKDGSKALPGSGPRIFVTDWNNDGIKDLLIGASIATMHGEFIDRFAWNWEEDEKIHSAGKDPANLYLNEADLQRYKDYNKDKLPEGISIDDYMTIRHIGYVYVMLGSKEANIPVSVKAQKLLNKGRKPK